MRVGGLGYMAMQDATSTGHPTRALRAEAAYGIHNLAKCDKYRPG